MNTHNPNNLSSSNGYKKTILGKTYTFQSKAEENAFRAFLVLKLCIDECKKNGKIKRSSNRKRNIKSRPKSFKSKFPKIAAFLVTAGIIASKVAPIDIIGPDKGDDMYTIAVASDLPDDKYDDSIPMKLNKGGKITLGDNTLVVVKSDEIGNKNNVIYLNKEGKAVEGTIKGEYLKSQITIKKDELLKYTDVYKVKKNSDAVIKSMPTNTDNYDVQKVKKGDIVLAGIPQVSSVSNNLWYPVLYFNENGVNKGVINEDKIELLERNIYTNNKNKKKPIQKTDEVIMVVDTSEEGKVPLKLRDNKSTSSKIITEIKHKSEIKTTVEDIQKTSLIDEHDWVKISYDNQEGYVDKNFLKEKRKIELQVQTDEEYIKLLSEANDNSDVLMDIPNGYIISMYEDDLDEKTTGIFDKKDWYKVNVCGIEGYVEADTLSTQIDRGNIDFDTEKEYDKTIKIPMAKNENGNVLILDFNGGNVNVEDLADLLNNGIDMDFMKVGTKDKKIAVGEYNGEISGVMIKIGATTANRDEIQISDAHYDKDIAEFCEKNGVPYGFYYYMGAETKDEAKKEWNYILDTLDELESREYNVLPFTLDVELGGRIKNDCTEAVIANANALKRNGENVMLYTSGNAAIDKAGRIINLEKFYNETGVSDMWFVYPKAYQEKHQNNYDNIPKFMNVVMTQEILDGKSYYGDIDLSVISPDNFKRLVKDNEKDVNIKFTKRKDIKPAKSSEDNNIDDEYTME